MERPPWLPSHEPEQGDTGTDSLSSRPEEMIYYAYLTSELSALSVTPNP